MRISVDVGQCIGAGQCVLSAPSVFDQADDGLVSLLVHEPARDENDAVHQAERHCPSGAIRLLEN